MKIGGQLLLLTLFMNIPGIDFVSNPAPIISSTEYSIKSAMWYYKVKVIDKLSIESTTVEAVTKKINGGDNGLADRKTYHTDVQISIRDL